MDSLTSRILRYQRTGEEREAILSEVSRKVIAFPRLRHRWDEDACADFLAHMYPRVEAMIRKFEHRGIPFDGYLSSVLAHQCRSFATARRTEQARWRLAEDRLMWEEHEGEAGPGPEEEPDCEGPGGGDARSVFGIDARGCVCNPAARRKLLVAALKHYDRLPCGAPATLARLTGESEERLERMIAELHENLESQRERVCVFRGRRNRAFTRLCLLERQLAAETDEQVRAELRRRCRALRAILRRNQRTLAGVRLQPTNRDIARALGIPKGTVDSILHRLKLRATSLYASEHADYA